MRTGGEALVVLLGVSQWPDADQLLAGFPAHTTVIRAPDAAAAINAVAPSMPRTVTLLVPPDLRETLRFIDQIKRRFRVPVRVIDPDDDERIERLCRLAGCAEYIAAGTRRTADHPRPSTPSARNAPNPRTQTSPAPCAGHAGGSPNP